MNSTPPPDGKPNQTVGRAQNTLNIPSKIYLVGMSCIGKTTIGKILAQQLNYAFFDLDEEIEAYFGTSIERLQNKFPFSDDFRREASKALQALVINQKDRSYILALTPSSLKRPYLKIVRQSGAFVIYIEDTPKNILSRITFYDIDSKLITKTLSVREKQLYLKEISLDLQYFKPSYKKADLTVNITNLGVDDSTKKIMQNLHEMENKNRLVKSSLKIHSRATKGIFRGSKKTPIGKHT